MPCMAWDSAGMGICGFTNQVLLSLFPLGKTFKIEISTIRSLATLVPVVSRSKKHMGLVNFNSIRGELFDCMFGLKSPKLHIVSGTAPLFRSYFPLWVPGLEIIGHGLDEHPAQGPVHHPVVVTVGQEHFASYADILPLIGLNDRGHFTNGPQGQYAHLGLVDDRGAENTSKG